MSLAEPVPQSTFRAVARLAALLVTVLPMIPLCTLIVLAAGVAGSRARYRMVMALTPIVCGTIAALVGLRVRIAGRRSDHALIFVGNHVTYLDILTAGVGVGGVFVSRHDVKQWPVIGIFARLAGTVFLDRSSLRSAVASSDGVLERAEQGIRITIFPEGVTTSGAMAPFRPFLFSAVARGNFPVQPFTIRYTHIGGQSVGEANKDLVYWYDPAPGLDVHGWRLLKLPYVRATITFHEVVAPPHSSEKGVVREFAEELQRRVAAGLGE